VDRATRCASGIEAFALPVRPMIQSIIAYRELPSPA